MSRCRRLLLSALVIFGVCAGVAKADRYGFGVMKRTVLLERRLLPDVQLGNVSLAVVFPRGAGGLDTNAFVSQLETLIAQSGSGIRLVDRGPEFQIQCYTTAFQAPRITATTQNGVTMRQAHGQATLDARIVHVADGAVALAFREAVYFNAGSGGGHQISLFGKSVGSAPASEPMADSDTDATLGARMVRELALEVASHMVRMNENLSVLLAGGGPLNDIDKLGQNARWSEFLEKLEELPPIPDAADEAYRLYNIGVANEALGYAASDPKIALKYLRESSIDYSRAAEGKPDEKYFLAPQKRIETAIVRYTEIVARETAPPPRRPPPPSSAAVPEAPAPATRETLTNADVIKMVQAHLPKDLITNKIMTTPGTRFDLTVDGLIALNKAGVPSDIITLMNRRAASQPRP